MGRVSSPQEANELGVFPHPHQQVPQIYWSVGEELLRPEETNICTSEQAAATSPR